MSNCLTLFVGALSPTHLHPVPKISIIRIFATRVQQAEPDRSTSPARLIVPSLLSHDRLYNVHLWLSIRRLLSNNNDSDLLEISGIRPDRGKDHSTLVGPGCLPHRLNRQTEEAARARLRTTSRKGIEHIFALEKNTGVRISMAALNVALCHQLP